MNDPFIDVSEINNELTEIERMASKLIDSLLLLSQKVRYIISKINTCKNFEEANDYFNLLDKIQHVLAVLLYEKDMPMTGSLKFFTADFDHISDNDFRKYLFGKIKSGEYDFGKKLL